MPLSVGEAPKGVGVLLDSALEGVADEGVGEVAVFAGAEVDFVPDLEGALAGGRGDGFFDTGGCFGAGFGRGFGRGFGAAFGGDCFFGGGAGLLRFAGFAGFAGFFFDFFGAGAFTAFGGFDGGFAAAFFP